MALKMATPEEQVKNNEVLNKSKVLAEHKMENLRTSILTLPLQTKNYHNIHKKKKKHLKGATYIKQKMNK